MQNSAGGGPSCLSDLVAEGVSPWLDGLDRRWLDRGWFASVVSPKGVRGVVANPATLLDSLHDERVHRDQLAELAGRHVHAESAVVALALRDARTACDVLQEVFIDSGGRDGYVSVDLPARTAHDARAAVAASVHAAAQLARPNVMMKIPATIDGLTAMRSCLSRGIGVHATEVYSLARYRQVVAAYFDGMEAAAAAGLRLAAISSVVALPVGWIDLEIDARLNARPDALARSLLGRAGLAAARLVYQEYEQQLGTGRWRALHAAGARPQRLVWMTATSAGSGARYVAQIVGWSTVTALSPAALTELGGAVELSGDTLLGEQGSARAVVDGLRDLGIVLPAVVRRLEHDGAHRAGRHWDELSAAVRSRLADLPG